jgi:tRNA (uracil-5-)-methyltransferase TRM9
MHKETAHRLLEINREFYAAVAEPFDQTRHGDSPGKQQLIAHLAHLAPDRTLRVLDVGCGNGRLAWMLERLARPVEYMGVDGEAQLLALAAENTRRLQHVRVDWRQADLADPQWTEGLSPPYDAVVCLATLQHLPSFELRARVLADLAGLAAPQGRVAISAWQFLTSPRLAAKQLAWREMNIDPAQVEPGDAILPWQQERYAVRYVHQIDAGELAQLAAHAGLHTETLFYADGKEGNLNLYAILLVTPRTEMQPTSLTLETETEGPSTSQ